MLIIKNINISDVLPNIYYNVKFARDIRAGHKEGI
jgi:hypothetical protein